MDVRIISACGSRGECPQVLETDRGTYIVQGKVLDDEAKSTVSPPEGENAVEIPKALLENLLG